MWPIGPATVLTGFFFFAAMTHSLIVVDAVAVAVGVVAAGVAVGGVDTDVEEAALDASLFVWFSLNVWWSYPRACMASAS